ncbi:MAG: transketolase [Elusimicrobia bacterium CG1_02_63_36]|nr:MAG: transketolase [Elusimicrobia bacterium CG1_02_63_36]PIP84246.1 MAG: transketolase [Elusimicrobia bacterium CG22_combo_CG10-13_8_21_14_all_63_91]PJA17140.1 MAG: transketolase [Elusimicrobia bacterium CG_4_10_14_0_2_um_filter_63_34]PJB25513.1 MAG: transketolase [Elusimicrobia bacterium CG_4_9_14_3_um_filter_62_55]
MATANAERRTDYKDLTRGLRVDIIRMLEKAGSGHPGGSLSIIDILAVLYDKHFQHRPQEPNWPDRDRMVLSKGHACPALYALMAHHGYFPKPQLDTLRKLGSPLQGHPDRMRLPGIEVSTGSLGQGLSIAQGMAMSAKMDAKGYHTWCVLGDGEMQEGQIWEALMSAPKFGLGNLTAILDFNNSQIDGSMEEVMNLNPIADKIRAFHWNVIEFDGHDFEQIEAAILKAKSSKIPSFLIAKTVKGKGVSFMENQIGWHGKAPNKEEADKACEEIRHG